MKKIIINKNDKSTQDTLSALGERATAIKIAVAFFSDVKLIKSWFDSKIKVELIISLRPPTNYYSLKDINSMLGIDIQFLGKEFHSKFWIFYENEKPFAAIIGSSNFTSGGLKNNIETNAILYDRNYLNEIESYFNELWSQSFLLQPSDLEKYKKVYDDFKERDTKTENEQLSFENSILNSRSKTREKMKINENAQLYNEFWRIVDEVRDYVIDISEKEYPGIPAYLTVDHFWHWIKKEWDRESHKTMAHKDRKLFIRALFSDYCNWDKSTGNYTMRMFEISNSIFSNFLAPNKINSLSIEQAKEIYSNLHSGSMRTRRFSSDETFVDENSIEKIRASLNYLLHSNDDIEVRISNLHDNEKYKLNEFGFSAIQEVIGWAKPREFPLRNDKADEALNLIGYEFPRKEK
ncbi:MAG: NgoFVII family restriction endonuclease [Saprospiraceae bacterium]|nr:NgoFVII family restriction endonuclease [Saprospiraceae bacterium]